MLIIIYRKDCCDNISSLLNLRNSILCNGMLRKQLSFKHKHFMNSSSGHFKHGRSWRWLNYHKHNQHVYFKRQRGTDTCNLVLPFVAILAKCLRWDELHPVWTGWWYLHGWKGCKFDQRSRVRQLTVQGFANLNEHLSICSDRLPLFEITSHLLVSAPNHFTHQVLSRY